MMSPSEIQDILPIIAPSFYFTTFDIAQIAYQRQESKGFTPDSVDLQNFVHQNECMYYLYL